MGQDAKTPGYDTNTWPDVNQARAFLEINLREIEVAESGDPAVLLDFSLVCVLLIPKPGTANNSSEWVGSQLG